MWTGDPNPCIASGDCYCEAFSGGWVQQPANTWSALAFTFVGIWILAHARKQRTLFPAAVYALIVAWVGPGTMAFHATMTKWGGVVDSTSMYFLGAFVLLYALLRLGHVSRRAFLPALLGSSLVLFISKALDWTSTEVTFGVLLGAGVLAEGIAIRKSGMTRRPWIWTSLGLFAAAFAFWTVSHTGGPMCDPQSLLQGHALWHILSAFAAGTLYLHYSAEAA